MRSSLKIVRRLFSVYHALTVVLSTTATKSDNDVAAPLFTEYGGIAEILMAMDTAVGSDTIIRLGARALACLAEHEASLRAEVAAGDGLGLLIEALETHARDASTAAVLLITFTNIMLHSEDIKVPLFFFFKYWLKSHCLRHPSFHIGEFY